MKNINEPKKILLIFADSSVRAGLADAEELKRILQEAGDARQQNMEFYATYARSLSFLVTNTASRIYDHRNKLDLADYDFVYFRKAGAVMQQMLACAIYLQEHNIPYFDTEIGATNSRNKLSQMFMLQQHGVPVPPTLFCRHRKRLVRLLTKNYKDYFTWPVIAKATGGTRGNYNYLVKSPEELTELLHSVHRQFLIQSFIPNDGDYRALVIGSKLRGLIKRVGQEGSHLNNTSKNGSAEWLPIGSVDSYQQIIAIKAARVCKRDVAGVDILVNRETGEPYVLEVNRAPQIENATYPREKAQILVEGIQEAIDEHDMSVVRPESKPILGRREYVGITEFPILGKVIAKVDTGAYSNSLHCSYIQEHVDKQGKRTLSFSPFGDKREIMTTENYFVKKVTSSNGIPEMRYIVELHLQIGDKELQSQVSLTNREQMLYPMLIGRKFLKKYHYVVDVSKRFSL